MKNLLNWFGEKRRLRNRLATMSMELDDQKRVLAHLRAEKRPLILRVPEREMSDDELAAELAVDDENPVWAAVHQIINRCLEDSVELVASTEGERRVEAAGGIDCLRDLQRTLLDYQRRGREVEAKEAA